MAAGNQMENICRNGNEKTIWQLKRAEIVMLLYSIYLATGNPRVMTFEGFCYFFAIF
jgi:hypothetical protein